MTTSMRAYTILSLILCLICWTSCSKDDSVDHGEITLEGLLPTEGETLSLQPETRRNVLLRGGNGKYSATSEYSDVASASVVRDTLRIIAYREGETKVRIHSQDRTHTIKIQVSAPPLSFSRDEIYLFPGYENKQVRLSGGGEIVRLRLDDPSDCISVRWNASTSMLELKPRYEGDATIYAITSDGSERKLSVKVRPESSEILREVGFYATGSKSYYKLINTRMVVQRHGKGIWLVDALQPTLSATRLYIFASSLEGLEVGKKLDLPIELSPGTYYQGSFASGDYPVIVERADSERIVLLGKGFKLVLPVPVR